MHSDPNAIATGLAPVTPLHGRLYWTVWSVVAAFGAYFCMYAFRKPFTATADTAYGDLSLKTLFVTSQVMGYATSKFIGIGVIAAMRPERRAALFGMLILFAELALVAFALVPPPWNAACMFLNGLPLGMVFGLVLGFLEGRQLTELLTAGLCASFILADGVTKSVGSWLLGLGISPYWMPSVAGLLFAVPLAICIWMLTRIPPPNVADIAARHEREPMSRADCWILTARYAWGLSLIILMYLMVTILRSLRADFAPELWSGLGAPAAPQTFTYSELCVMFGVLLVNGCAVLIRDNRQAFFASLATCAFGVTLLAVALSLQQAGQVGGFGYMVLVGLGLYLPYVATHTTVFERLLAMTREKGNLGYLLYLADAVGYLGLVAVMLLKGVLAKTTDMLAYFNLACWLVAGISLVCVALSWRYFARTPARQAAVAMEPS